MGTGLEGRAWLPLTLEPPADTDTDNTPWSVRVVGTYMPRKWRTVLTVCARIVRSMNRLRYFK